MNKTRVMEFILDHLKALVNIPSPVGMTEKAEQWVMERLKALGFVPWQNKKGGVFVQINQGEGPGILLTAHIDTIGLMVRSVKSNSRLGFSRLGGFPLQYVEQENVLVHTAWGQEYPGTLRLNEPAVHANDDLAEVKRTPDTMEIVLDLQVKTKEDTLARGISAGDYISLDPRFKRSGEGFIKSRHLDNKAAAAVVLALAKAFKDGEAACPRPVYVLFSNYEEIGHGASSAHPEGIEDMIAVDMGVVGRDLTCDEYQVCICAKDIRGPYHRALTQALVKTAKANGLAYSTALYPYYYSDTTAALTAGYDYRHALIGPGVAASHGYERTHEEGLWNTLLLLKHYLAEPV